MRRKCSASLLGLFSLLTTVALPVLAHHSVTAEFNPDKEIVVKGVLTRFEYTNPHSYFFVDVTDENGKVVNYAFESSPPSMLHRAGFKKDDAKIGDTVTVTAMPAKDGTKNLGWVKMIKYSDGHVSVFRTGSE